MNFLANNKILVLSVAMNVFLIVALSMLLKFVYPHFFYELYSVTSLGQYSVRTYGTYSGSAYFEILLGPEEYLGQLSIPRRIYSCAGRERFFFKTFSDDMTGKGVPELIMEQYLGGAHGLSRYFVFELDGSAVKKIDVINGLDAEFQDLNNDGMPEITGIDRAYGYFLGDSHAASPCPLVVLSFDKIQGKFVLDKLLMLKSPYSQDQLNKLSLKYKEDIRWQKESRPPSELFDTMLKLIYSGNEKQAWELFDASWPDGSKISKEKYREDVEGELKRALKYSPFYPEIAEWNKNKS